MDGLTKRRVAVIDPSESSKMRRLIACFGSDPGGGGDGTEVMVMIDLVQWRAGAYLLKSVLAHDVELSEARILEVLKSRPDVRLEIVRALARAVAVGRRLPLPSGSARPLGFGFFEPEPAEPRPEGRRAYGAPQTAALQGWFRAAAAEAHGIAGRAASFARDFRELSRRYRAGSVIARAVDRAALSPHTPLGRRRLLHEFHALQGASGWS
jgi:hypothetical protein